jgi:fatty acid desaturase
MRAMRGECSRRPTAGVHTRGARLGSVESMDTKTSTPNTADDLEANWRTREEYWRRKLGRLRLGVEPIEEQLARYRRVTWALTAVPAALAVFFFTLFAVFGYPLVGLVLDAVILLPIVLGAWADYALMALRARRYRAEADQFARDRDRHRPASGD